MEGEACRGVWADEGLLKLSRISSARSTALGWIALNNQAVGSNLFHLKIVFRLQSFLCIYIQLIYLFDVAYCANVFCFFLKMILKSHFFVF